MDSPLEKKQSLNDQRILWQLEYLKKTKFLHFCGQKKGVSMIFEPCCMVCEIQHIAQSVDDNLNHKPTTFSSEFTSI